MSPSNEQLYQQLQRVTRSILDPGRPAYSLRSEVLELKSLFQQAGGGKFSEMQNDIAAGETKTPGGVVISPTMAAMCVDDYARTVQFLRGIHEAIVAIGTSIKGRPMRILYAGCGPWATLVIPMMSTFSAAETSFTLLDIHPESIGSVEQLVGNLGLIDYVAKLVTADAAEYMIPHDEAPDIIVIEMIRAALDAEPQVAVARHLLGQTPQAVMIPEEVRIDLALLNQSREFVMEGDSTIGGGIERDRIMVGAVAALNKDTLASWGNPCPSRLAIPEFDETIYRPMLLTTIRVFGEQLLADHDSGITCPKALRSTVKPKPGETIEFSYALTGRPGLRAELV